MRTASGVQGMFAPSPMGVLSGQFVLRSAGHRHIAFNIPNRSTSDVMCSDTLTAYILVDALSSHLLDLFEQSKINAAIVDNVSIRI
jgi:hypothetical protein